MTRSPEMRSIAVGSKARISKERILAFSLWFALFAHGLFYLREWLALGAALSIFLAWEVRRRRRGRRAPAAAAGLVPLWPRPQFDAADALFPGLIALSLGGLFRPVKAEMAYWEALRWAVLWLIMRWGRAAAGPEKSWLEKQVLWAGLVLALAGWLPWIARIWSAPLWPEAGRLSSFFGYPNAAAAFLAAVLVLRPKFWWQRAVLFLALVDTGSRGAVLMYLGLGLLPEVWPGLRLCLRRVVRRHERWLPGQEFLARWPDPKRLVPRVVAAAAMLAAAVLFRPGWRHLFVSGFGTPSWSERLWYWQDGVALAAAAGGLPRAGGWLAFPLIQDVPYWTADPHSSLISVLVNEGLPGVVLLGAFLAVCWQRGRSGQSAERRRRRRALLLLFGHSLVDADFSFGVLGVLFWLLFGLEAGAGGTRLAGGAPRRRSERWEVRLQRHRGLAKLGLRALGFVLAGGVLVSVTLGLITAARVSPWAQSVLASAQVQASGRQPGNGAVNWQQALAWDQTQTAWRRAWAADLLRRGDLAAGLQQLDLVLRWDSWSLANYEWAQGLLWETAEILRDQGRAGSALLLYRRVADMPERVKARRESVPVRDRQYWQGYGAFVPTEHLEFLAETARRRIDALPGA